MGHSRGRLRRRLLGVSLLVLVVRAHVPEASAANISWAGRGPFEACLETAADAWIGARAALVVNQDAAASRINDAGVAAWTVAAVEQCRTQGVAAEATSVERFEKHMTRWREHIYDLASSIRQKAPPD